MQTTSSILLNKKSSKPDKVKRKSQHSPIYKVRRRVKLALHKVKIAHQFANDINFMEYDAYFKMIEGLLNNLDDALIIRMHKNRTKEE